MLRDLVLYCRNSPVMSSQARWRLILITKFRERYRLLVSPFFWEVPEMCRPLVFKDGQPVSFPAPTTLSYCF